MIIHRLSLYEGRRRVGALEIKILKRGHRTVRARDADGKQIGKFKSQKDALAAINQADAKRSQA
jgi:hypothetical protein